MSTLSANVRVRVEVEIHVGAWPLTSKFSELQELASREALQTLSNNLRECGLRIHGTPKVLVSTYTGDEK